MCPHQSEQSWRPHSPPWGSEAVRTAEKGCPPEDQGTRDPGGPSRQTQGWAPSRTVRGLSGMERPASWRGGLAPWVRVLILSPVPLAQGPSHPPRPWGECLLELWGENCSLLKGHGGLAPGDGHLRLIFVRVQLGGLTSRIPPLTWVFVQERNLGGSHCPGPALRVGQQLRSGRVQLPAGHRAEGGASALLFHG